MKVYEDVPRRHATDKDRFGDPTGPASSDVITKVRVAPRDSREGAERANSIVTAFTLQCPAGTIVLPDDQLFVRGFWRSVEGEPFDAGRKGVLVTVTGGTG